mgnify:CR=1 FL=1
MVKINKLYTYTAERKFTLVLFMGLVGMVLLYILLVFLTTFNVSSHRALQNNIQAFHSNLSDLESEYTAQNSMVTKEKAVSLGFVQPKKEIFAFRQRLVQNGL